MNGSRTPSSAPVGHRDGLRGRLPFGVAVRPREALLGVILALAFLATPVPSPGQHSKVYRIGWLASVRSETDPRVCWRKASPFRQTWTEAMRERGYTLGQNLAIECRYTDGRNERAPAFAAELVNLKVDLIIAGNTTQVRAAKQATSTIPIVMFGVIDPVRRRLVGSLARPGGNVTGLTDDAGMEILGKYLELLTQAVPTASRVAALRAPASTPGDPATADWPSILQAEARALGLTLQSYLVRDPGELEGAFAAMTEAHAEALLVTPSPFFSLHRHRIVDLAAQSRLPAMYPDRPDVEAGGLMAYAVDDLETARRLAAYVDRILKGAKPGDLPVEQPTTFELIINLKTAKALGLKIPRTLLMQADELIR
jgi:putative ABC transport system substrate-binding protein